VPGRQPAPVASSVHQGSPGANATPAVDSAAHPGLNGTPGAGKVGAGSTNGGGKNASGEASGPSKTTKTSKGGLSDAALAKLNSRLNGMLGGGTVAYSDKHLTNDLAAAIAQAEADYFKAAAPPADVLAKALYVVTRNASLFEPARIMYVLKKRRIFGFAICTGWLVEPHPPGGGAPAGWYTVGPCTGADFEPPPGLPTPRPSP